VITTGVGMATYIIILFSKPKDMCLSMWFD
jgi:hypothetical protein